MIASSSRMRGCVDHLASFIVPRKPQNRVADFVHRNVAALFLDAREIFGGHIEHILRVADKFCNHQIAIMRHPILHQASHIFAVSQRPVHEQQRLRQLCARKPVLSVR